MSDKAKKIVNIVVDVFVAIILVFVLIIAIGIIQTRTKHSNLSGYTEIFGMSFVAVETDSMAGDKPDSFNKGDMISIKILNDEEKKNLQVGDIITFQITDPTVSSLVDAEGKLRLNTHRIVEVKTDENGTVSYITKGDANLKEDLPVLQKFIVGQYQGKASGIGAMFLWMRTSAGFFVCVVLPSLIAVLYFAINLVLVIFKESKKKQLAEIENRVANEEDMKERLRAELLKEMQESGQLPQDSPKVEEPKPENGEPEEQATASEEE